MEICPFEVGDAVECRTFQEGYYGAWFRCKLEAMRFRKEKLRKNLWCKLRYTDFDESHCTKLYQYPKQNRTAKALMLRPAFPPILKPEEASAWSHEGALFGVMNRDFDVGDYAEWRTGDEGEFVYWICQVAEVVSDKEVRVVCPSPPWGANWDEPVDKGLLRPALDWLPSCGWTVPLSKTRKPGVPLVSLVNAKPPANAERFNFMLATPFVEDWIDFGQGSRKKKQRLRPLRHTSKAAAGDSSTERAISSEVFDQVQIEADGIKEQTEAVETPTAPVLPVCAERKLAVARKLVHHAKLRLRGKDAYCHPRCTARMRELKQKKLVRCLCNLEELSETVAFCKEVLRYGFKQSMAMRNRWDYVLFRAGNRFLFQSLPSSPSE